MANIVKLIQGSPEWHAHRERYRNASETATVLGANPWQTPLQLWEIRSGRTQPVVNAAMARGTQLEPLAREAYERLTGQVMQPLVLVEGAYSASLDGLTFDGELALEIKCPVKGKTSSLWQAVSQGHVPEHYGWQTQQRVMVSGAARVHLFVFDGDTGEGTLAEIAPLADRWAAIRDGWEAFMQCIEHDVPPPLTDKDQRQRQDPEWMIASAAYLKAKRATDAAEAELDRARKALLQLATHVRETGNGLTVTRYWKTGTVDYKRIPQLNGVDLDAFRGKGRFETRITLDK